MAHWQLPVRTVAQLTTDAQGRASSRADLLPCGDYALVEIKAPEGYLAEGVTQQSFSITGDGMMADLTGAGQVLSDQVIRGGVTVAETGFGIRKFQRPGRSISGRRCF